MPGYFLIGVLLFALATYFNRNIWLRYILVGGFVSFLCSFGVYEYFHQNEIQLSFFKPDSLGVLLLLTLCLVSIPVIIHSFRYLEKHNIGETAHSKSLYFSAIILLISSCGVSYLSNHIAVNWIFLEITTLSASALIYHHRNLRALEGVWKYVFVCAISITFIYIGILFLSMAMKSTGTDDMSFDVIYKNFNKLNPFWLKLSFIFIFTGFTAKLGLVPMFTAGIDAKDSAPAPAGALMASVLMNVGFTGIYRTFAIFNQSELHGWATRVILIAAILSIFVATVYMTRIKNIKRMFAYSGIEHMGLVMLGLAAGKTGVYAAILHLILHTLMKPALFLQYNQIYWVYQSKSIYDVGHYFKYNRTGAVVVLLGFISATAIPPSGLFVSELLVFQSLFLAQHFVILGFVLLFLTLIIWGFATNVFKLLFTPPVDFNDSSVPKISAWESLSQYILLALAIFFAYFPPKEFIELLNGAAKLIGS